MNTEQTARAPLRGLIGFNVLSGIVLGIVGFYFGWWLGHQIHFTNYDYFADTGQNDIALFLATCSSSSASWAGSGSSGTRWRGCSGGSRHTTRTRKAASAATSASAPTTR